MHSKYLYKGKEIIDSSNLNLLVPHSKQRMDVRPMLKVKKPYVIGNNSS
jgi:hypothetical protein